MNIQLSIAQIAWVKHSEFIMILCVFFLSVTDFFLHEWINVLMRLFLCFFADIDREPSLVNRWPSVSQVEDLD